MRMRTRAKKRTHVLKPVYAYMFVLPIFRLYFVLVRNFKTIVEIEDKNMRYYRPVKIRKLISCIIKVLLYINVYFIIKFK